ncbi:MAG: DUF4384 domain-containing protein [Nitrospira sp.]|nr:DUF4384 domain-containing protein [Nitrospira sp.]
MCYSTLARTVLLLLIAIGCITVHDQVEAQQPGPPSSVAKRALLIGINKYHAVPKLQGSLNDIETMKRVLVSRWGFPEGNIRLLTDEQATRDGMLAALNQFVSETGPLDTVYIHYSGHGSQVADLNGDEPDDQLDETLVPQDGRTGTIPDITDDELDVIFGRLPTKNAFIVLDSCHSGTATRSLDIRTRSVPQDTRIDLYQAAPKQEVQTRGNIQLLPAHFVLMTGAASHQEALDGPVEGRYHGFFSYALSKSLSSTPVGATPREIFRGVETELKRIQTHFGRASMPEPQLEAPPDLLERPLLGAAGSPPSRLAWAEVKPTTPGTITLVNGLLLGAAPGSTWAIYPPGDTAFTPGWALAIATVTHLDGQHAQAKLHPAGKKIQDRSRAVAFLPASAGEKIPIHLLNVPSSQRKQIEQMLQKQIPNLELVGPEQAPRYMVSTQGSTIQLLAADGIQLVGSFDRDGWAAGVAMVVSRSAHASELLTLDNPSSQLKIDLRVANAPAPGKPKVGTRGIAVVAADTQPARYRIRKPGKPRTAENTLQLQVKVNADAYISIVDVDSEGGVNLLFPNDYAKPSFYPEGFVKGGEIVLIPDSLHDSNRAGFYWDYSPPKGMDTVRVFSSTDLETAQMIRQRIKELQASASKTPGKISTRAVGESIDSIREDLVKRAARGIVAISDPTPHQPGLVSTELSTEPGLSPLSDPSNLSDIAVTPESIPPTPAGPVPDWAATSITIKVEG